MAVAGVLELQLIADVARLRQDVDRMNGIVTRGAKQMQEALDNVRNSIGGLFGGASVLGFANWIRSAIDFQDQLNDLSKSTNLSVEKLSGLSLMAKQSGGDLTSLAQSVNKLQLEIGKAPEKFAKIGITAKDGLEAFKQLADVYQGIEDPQLRAAVAAEALGKAWAGSAPVLAEGSQRIDEMVKRGMELSGVTQEGADKADEFNDKLAEFEAVLRATAIRIGNDMLPLLTEFVSSLVDTTDEANRTDQGFSLFTETLRALIVFGGNVAFVIRGIGTEIGGLAAQLAAFARLDFAQASEIGKMMKEDAAKARADFDAWEARMMNAGNGVKKSAEEGTSAHRKLSQAALRSFIDNDKASKEAEKAAEALEHLLSRIKEHVDTMRTELVLGRQLTDEEKFRLKAENDFQELQRKYPSISKARLTAMLAESLALSQQLDIRKAEQQAATNFAKQWEKEQEELAAFESQRAAERDRVLAGIREQTLALQDSNSMQEMEATLISASADERGLALDSLQIELRLKRQIDEINQNLLLTEEARTRAIANAMANAAEERRQLGERASIAKQMEVADDIRGALRDGILAGLRDGKNPAKVFAEVLANAIYNRVATRLADAIMDGLGNTSGLGGGSLLGNIIGYVLGTGSGGGPVNLGTATGADMSLFYSAHSGAVVGGGAVKRYADPGVFFGAPRFHSGGIVGDEVPIIAKRGEEVGWPSQLAQKYGGGDNVSVTQNIMVGDFVSRDQMREEMRASEKRMIAGLQRKQTYGSRNL